MKFSPNLPVNVSAASAVRLLSHRPLRAVFALLLIFPALASATPLVATDGTFLSRFNSDSSTTVTSVSITGMQSGEKLVGIDYRPATGELYGIGNTSRLYRLDAQTGTATPVGNAGAFNLNGSKFGVDFNPVTDRLRVVSDTEQNLRINPNDGSLASTDANLHPSGNVVEVGHSNNLDGAAQTTVYGIDSGYGQLVHIGGVNGAPNSPNAGGVTKVGSLGLGGNLDQRVGFDVAANGAAYATIITGGLTRLYTIDLQTGSASLIGTAGSGLVSFIGLSAVIDPPLVVTKTDDSGAGSLRQAILDSNATTDVDDVIRFNIPGPGPHKISPVSALPIITERVRIDGTSQPGFNPANRKPVVVLDGSAAPTNTTGVRVNGPSATGTEIRGLQIVKFPSFGVVISSAPETVVAGCYVGTDGTAALGNGNTGIFVDGNSSDVVIGGSAPADRNVIAANTSTQVSFLFGGTSGGTIAGNFIGTNAAGTAAIKPEAASGIILQNADHVTVGGNTADRRNVISGLGTGISVRDSADTNIVGNFIGINAAGSAPIKNLFGIALEDDLTTGTMVGGDSASVRNVISGNNFGVSVGLGVHNNFIQGNYIGTDATGKKKVGNNGAGVLLYQSTLNVVGGGAAGEGNVISGNETGVLCRSCSANLVQGNLIGTARDGVTPLGNTTVGVRIETFAVGETAEDNVVGGAGSGGNPGGNTIAFNGGAGVFLASDERTARNAIFQNSIHSNGGLGIDLAPKTAGFTPNDSGDQDKGPNGLQNFPVLKSATKPVGGALQITGTFNSTPNSHFGIDFYGGELGDGEGRIFIGDGEVLTDGNGKADLSYSFATSGGQEVTATVTKVINNVPGDTSEFSRPVKVNGGGAVRFPKTQFEVDENAGAATITVVRVDGSDGAVSVDYGTSDGTATHPADYVEHLGTLKFAPGQTKATFTVQIKNDVEAEPDETIHLYLTTPTGAILGAPSGADLTIRASDQPTKLVNISTRLHVGAGEDALFGGFIITGDSPKTLIARALGPSLPVNGKLGNPKLEVYNSSHQLIAMNDNWKDAPNKQAIIDTQIAPTKGLESAILGDIPPGSYTTVVSGATGGTGIGSIEIYDLNATADSELANISARGVVNAGDNVMVAGFIMVGSDQRKLIVRALGPSLPVNSKLANPALELFDSNGTSLAQNNNWRSDQEAAIKATGVPPPNDLESAIVTTLPPGAYTAVVHGINGSGVAVVEVYALD